MANSSQTPITFAVGAFNGIWCTLLAQPFDVLKTSMILAPHNEIAAAKTTIMESVSTIYTREGFRGFFRGLQPALLRKFFASGIYFAGLQGSNQYFRPKFKNRILSDMISANVARALENLLTNPFLVIETRFEVIGFNEYKTMRQAAISMHKKEGVTAFGKGMLITTLRDIPGTTLFYPLYEKIKTCWPKSMLNTSKKNVLGELELYVISSFIASGISVLELDINSAI